MAQSRYTVGTAPAVDKQLSRMPRSIQRRLTEAIEGLESNPRPHGVKKLEGHDDLWRVRVGDYRIIYTIEDDRLLVLVVKIGHRGDVYRG